MEKDPEPIEHGPNDRPRNPPPKFVGDLWEEIVIDARWRRTITTVPAPKVALAPVLLQFAITNATAPWSVTIGGFTATAPAGQTTLTVNIWDRTIMGWTIQSGAGKYSDQLRIQRPGALPGAGAFTIPVVPVAIIYAPPKDSLNRSVATYGVGDTIGTTTSYDFSTDSSGTTGFTDNEALKSLLDQVGTDASLAGNMAAKTVLAQVNAGLGTSGETDQSGTVEGNGSALTVTDTSSEAISTNTSGGGPGHGDVIVFYKNMRVGWAYDAGQLRLSPLGYTQVQVTADYLKANLAQVGIASADQQRLLSLDPFAAAAPSFPPDRFTPPDGGEVHLEYGGGLNIDRKFVKTRDTKSTTTEKTYTTNTSTWDYGAFLRLFGFAGDVLAGDKTSGKSQITATTTNATGTDVSTTVSLEANLFAGPSDYFAVTILYDQLFGTWALQPTQTSPSAIVSGRGAKPGEVITLKAGKATYVTVANAKGAYQFRAKSIPKGRASLSVGSQRPTTVTVGASQ